MSEIERRFASANEACVLFDAELEAYLEGEVKPRLEAHAAECVFCGAVLADLASIRAAIGDLVLEEPPARLWANIRATLIGEGIIRAPQSFWERWLSRPKLALSPVAAVAAAVLVVLSVAVLRNSPRFAPGAAKVPGVSAGSVGGAANDHQIASDLQEMESSYEARSSSLDPSLRAEYEEGLRSLDGQINDCLDSVKRDPENTLARDYLNAAYFQKAQVLQSALELGGR